MKSQRSLVVSVVLTVGLLMGNAVQSWAAPKKTTPPVGVTAGSISALLPVAKISRGYGRNQVVSLAKKGETVVWNDVIRTERGGRARITLNDQSVLSLGSQAELKIIKHDARSQQTQLQLGYGRLRAEVAAVTRDGGKFELRTPTAVAGVIGTDFGSDSSVPGTTDFICISGTVNVSNSDPSVPGTVACPAGSTVSVSTGTAPTQPTPATPQQIQQLITDTEPATISAFSPATGLPGITLTATASGSNMASINAVSTSGTGTTVTLSGTPTATSATVSLVIAADAAPGPRTITFTNAKGQSTAAIFTVLASPTASTSATVDVAALKQQYDAIIEQERQSEIAGINAILMGVQQSAAQGTDQVSQANSNLSPPLSLTPMQQDLNSYIQTLVAKSQDIAGKLNADAQSDTATFNTAADTAANAKNQTADQIRAGILDAFNKVNGQFEQSVASLHSQLTGPAISTNNQIVQEIATWMANVNAAQTAQNNAVPVPAVNNSDKLVDLGADFEFDASNSKGTNGASVTNVSWTLCDPSYKPAQIGVPIAANAPGCNALSGYTSSNSTFDVQTCNLTPNAYIARVTITDSNQKQSAMDVRLTVGAPSYDDPATRLSSLVSAYDALQISQFLSFFDPSYSGYTSLQQNIQNTFPTLASMNINLVTSQNTIDCNTATLRGTWDQKYTFVNDGTCASVAAGQTCQRVVFDQSEQLTVQMTRTPGKGWFITNFQGDNGQVNGTPPGPIVQDVAIADLTLTNLQAQAGGTSIAPGNVPFTATVNNVGNGTLNVVANVLWTLYDSAGNQIVTTTTQTPIPLAGGSSTQVTATLNVPDLGPGVQTKLVATVNPNCTVPEKNCDALNTESVALTLGTVDLALSNLTAVGNEVGTLAGTVSVSIANSGTRASNPSTGNLLIFQGSTQIGAGNIPSVPSNGSIIVQVPVVVPNNPGTQSWTARISPPALGDTNAANDSTSGTVTIVAPVVDLQVGAIAYTSAGSPPFLSGQSRGVTFPVANVGDAPSNSTDTFTCTLTNGTTSAVTTLASGTVASIAAGGTGTVTANFTVPVNQAGSKDFITCNVSQDPFESSSALANNSATVSSPINPNVDLVLANISAPPTALQMGSAQTVTFNVQNTGLDTAPAGANVTLTIGGTQVATTVRSSGYGTAGFSPTVLGSIAGGGSVSVTLNFTVPQLQAPPADISGVSGVIAVNANGAVVETNTSNDTFSASLRLVDFSINQLSDALSAVQGRSFSISPLVSFSPSTDPLPVTFAFTGIPAGLTQSGTSNANLTGTPSATGSFTIGFSGTSSGVTHTAGGTAGMTVVPEIAFTESATPTLDPRVSGFQTLSINVTGGLYPQTVTLGTLPTGISLSSSTPAVQTLSSAGTVSWQLSSTTAATTGSGSIAVSITDPGGSGISGTVPAGNITGVVGYTVPGYVDNSISVALGGTTPPWKSGQSQSVILTITNSGNVASASTDTYSCTLNGLAIGSGTAPSVAANGGIATPSITFTVPIDQYPSGNIACSLSTDPQETNTSNNAASTTVTIASNYDAAVNAFAGASPLQVGSTTSSSFTVTNVGTDTLPSGWSAGLTLAGQSVFTSSTQPALAPAASVSFNPSFTVPSPSAAPLNSTFPEVAAVTGNTGDANAANDSATQSINIVDFTVTSNVSSLTGVAGRAFSVPNAVTVAPSTDPLPLTFTFAGLPAGITNTGANLSGTPASSATAVVTPSVTSQGVSKSAASISITINPEITISASPVALTSSGSQQTLTATISGGIGTLTATLSGLPTGVSLVSSTATQTVSGGSVSWTLQSDFTSTPGSGNFTITVTDAGSSASGTPAGNVIQLVPYSINGQANYAMQSATITARGSGANLAAAPTGTNAFQVGETVTFQAVIQNIGNQTQSGTLTVDMTCSPSSCSNPVTVTAPAAGQSVTVNFTLPTSALATGSYTGAIGFTTALAQSSTTDDSLSGFGFDIYDFTITNPNSATVQNVPAGGTGTFTVTETQNPTADSKTIPLAAAGTAITSNVTFSPNSSTGVVTITPASNVLTGTQDTVTVVGSNFGVSRSTTQLVQYYTGTLDYDNGSVIDGTSSSTPLILPMGATAGTGFNLKLNANFAGVATLTLPVVTGVNITSTINTPVAGDIIDLTFLASTSASANTTFPLTITVAVPNTSPAQTITQIIYVRPVPVPDLTITSVTPAGAFSGRTFSASSGPLLSGEPGDFQVTIQNLGAAANSGGQGVYIHLGGQTGQQIQQTLTSLPQIAPGGTVTVTVHVVAPDPLPDNGSNNLTFEVQADTAVTSTSGAEQNLANNFLSVPVATSNWALQISGSGTNTTPISLTTTSGTSSAVVVLTPTLSGATAQTAYTLQAGAQTNGTALTVATISASAGQNSQTENFSYSGLNPGPYAMQVIGEFFDGGTVTVKRGVQIVANETGTAPTVTITSDRGNAVAGNGTTCSTGCTPIQVNGSIVENLNLTASRTPVGTGSTVDLIFTDDPQIVSVLSYDTVNNVINGVLQQTATVTYNTAAPFYFSPEDSSGSVTTGPAKVVVSAAAIGSVARGYPIQGTVGSQQTTLWFNIGDFTLTANNGTCITLPGGTSAPFEPITLHLNLLGNFNASTLNYTVQFPALTPVNFSTGSNPTGSLSFSGGYADISFSMQNAGANNPGVVDTFEVDFSETNALGSTATKQFFVAFSPNTTCAPVANPIKGMTASSAGGSSNSTIAGRWIHGAVVASTANKAVAVAAKKLPDVQVQASDVSFSPSIPRAGEPVSLRFRLQNLGDADAKSVPVALQVNGRTVATDTFDVKAGGSTLGGLTWAGLAAAQNTAAIGAGESIMGVHEMRTAYRGREMSGSRGGIGTMRAPSARLQIALVIDPGHSVPEKTALNKSVALNSLGAAVSVGTAPQNPVAPLTSQHLLLELSSSCMGLRIASGSAAPCDSGNMNVSIDDLASSRFSLASIEGIADLGAVSLENASASGASFGSQVNLQAGHSYAVQLDNNNVAVFQVLRVVNPTQLSAAALKYFQQQAGRLVRSLGGTNGAMQKGDVSGHFEDAPLVYVDMVVRNQ